ncbi:MAG: hypothetical protein JL50_05330 [Peptococcaceae bacterium BICA1-7]|nr:MAG: hypothetical protein JL50_05330 [Peptococcaceae bacterium BICA1-7]
MWEGLTSGYKIIEVIETYLMNSEDTELQVFLTGIIQGIKATRINRIEKLLKNEGFTVPPHPATKLYQGNPGSGQDVKLSDDEILLNIVSWGQTLLLNNAKAVGAYTRESVRKIFTDLLLNEIKAYKLIVNFGKRRKVFSMPPPATAKDNSLHMGEVFFLWDELGARHLSIMNLESYIADSDDKVLINLLTRGLNQVAVPQMERLENILKKEGFTVPPRPVRRINQKPPEMADKIRMTEEEIIGTLTVSFQAAILYHTRALIACMRSDIIEVFEEFLSTEIEEYQKLMELAKKRHALDNPPVVSSKKG